MRTETKYTIPESKKVTCDICHLTDNTGMDCPSDMDSDIHKGFSIGNGKTLYWYILWHKSGHCTVYSKENMIPRWLNGGTAITIHFH